MMENNDAQESMSVKKNHFYINICNKNNVKAV